MAETTEAKLTMSIDLKKNRLRVHKQTLRVLDSPLFVQLLFSAKHNAIVVLKCEKQTAGGQEIPVIYDKPTSAGTFDIYSKELITRIRNEFRGLNRQGLYHLSGYPVTEENGVCFPLSTLSPSEDTHA